MSARKLHSMTMIPEGKTVGDLLPVFSGVKHELFVGKSNPVCASCRKPFNAIRKPRKAIRMYPVAADVPLAYSFNICGACVRLVANGGADHDAVLASVEAYCEASEAKQ
jgi:hypothetical protein